MTKKRADALIFLGSSFTLFHRKQLVELATKSHLSTMCSSAAWIDAGCIISYGAILRRNSSISSAINLKRRSVQCCAEISLFSLDESGFPSAVNSAFLCFPPRDK
jgi:hypothetical protein